jgi:type III pantothenate kinase
MNLIIDIGNTSIKLAVFQMNKIVNTRTLQDCKLELEVDNVLLEFPKINQGIISCVGILPKKEIEKIQKKISLIFLNQDSKLPFKLQYSTTGTLGSDRLALVAAACNQYNGKNVLVIDAGSCITYDFVDKNKNYFGGAIAPGINMRYSSLAHFTSGLPNLQKKIPQHLTGNSTDSCIHSGIVNGVLNEIEGAVKEYQNKHPDLTVILTGGDTDFLCKQLKISIFANSDFLLEGLNFLLEINSNQL